LINCLSFLAVGFQVYAHYALRRFRFGMRNQPFDFVTNVTSLTGDNDVQFIVRAFAAFTEALDQQIGHRRLLTALYANDELNITLASMHRPIPSIQTTTPLHPELCRV
jgi:hypothetical protein